MIRVIWLHVNEINDMSLLDSLGRKLPEKYLMQATRFIKKQDQIFYILGKLLIAYSYKEMHKEYIDWAKLELTDQFIKPKYQGDFNFNISHSGNIVGCVSSFSNIDVGLDIQHLKTINTSEFQFVLTEKEYYDVIRSENVLYAFYKYWVLKEATLKLTGEGFSGDIKGFDFVNFQEKNIDVIYKENLFFAREINFPANKNHVCYVTTNDKVSSEFVDVKKINIQDLMLLYK